MPGPRSVLSISMPVPRFPSMTLDEIRPPSAYRIRFEPSSDTAIAMHSRPEAPNPLTIASWRATRLARSTSARSTIATLVGRSMSAAPLSDRHGRALAGRGIDRKVVHQAPRARETHPKPGSRCEPVPERPVDVRNARPVIVHDHFEANPACCVADLPHDCLAPPRGRVAHDVAGEFGDGGGDAALVDHA